jgi:uncharacterized protein
MPKDDESSRRLSLTATALSGFFECNRKTWLEIQARQGLAPRPGQNEIERLLLERRGRERERAAVESFRAEGLSVVTIVQGPQPDEGARTTAADQTMQAMKDGADVIYQGLLRKGDWYGYPDFLRKQPGESKFGAYLYEVIDAKLARVPTARAVVQMCVYSDLLSAVQEAQPEFFWILPGGATTPQRLRLEDYASYYRRAKASFEAFVDDRGRAEPYPEPVQHCDICQWWMTCDKRRRDDDHLSLVAGISRKQRERLRASAVATTEKLGALPPEAAVKGIEASALDRIRNQARIQVAGRRGDGRLYELLTDMAPGEGLEQLPPPSSGDLFLDLEGDSFAYENGLEYLFGVVELGRPVFDFVNTRIEGSPRYLGFWAADPNEEKAAFESLMKRMQDGLSAFPDMHIFHFGHREKDALKALSCRHGIREDLVDRILRGHVMVDLLNVVRQSLRASVEHYTLKNLEALYGFERKTPKRDAAWAMQMYGWWLETREDDPRLADYRETIERYNEDDCRSTWKLRDWLESQRDEFQRLTGRALGRPVVPEDKKDEPERVADLNRLRRLLIDGEPDVSPKRLLADLLSWHWRERKSGFWEHHEAKEVVPSERLGSRLVLADLAYVGKVDEIDQSYVHRYSFPADQDHIIRKLPGALDADTEVGQKIREIGPDYIDIRWGRRWNGPHPKALIPQKPISTKDQESRLIALANSIVQLGTDSRDRMPAARALLCRKPPTLGQGAGEPLIPAGEDISSAMSRLVLRLSGDILAVQGPPGSGKTYRAAEAIVSLVKAGKKVGVTANSHRVIAYLLGEAVEQGKQAGVSLRAHQLIDDNDEARKGFTTGKDFKSVRAKLQNHELDLVGGTAFAWSRDDFDMAVDVLIVDEAGQISLANALAVAGAATSLILFGDPAQLEQPTRGVHPPGAEVSALEHWLGGDRSMPAARGVFLPETRRLHPAICEFTSRVFYEGRLRPMDGLSAQCINGPAPFNGSGLRFVPVQHAGNTSRSDEEATVVAGLVESLQSSRSTFVDRSGATTELTADHVLVVTPFNAQVAALRAVLPADVQVGTVDKFQGGQAPVVIYSMTSSTGDDAPRGLEFLYNLNRLNVATSRATTLVVVVACPELLRARCRTPRQMQLVNALCAYEEMAGEIGKS